MPGRDRGRLSEGSRCRGRWLRAISLVTATALSGIGFGALVGVDVASAASTAPAITSVAAFEVYTGVHADFTVTTSGSPTPTVAESGTLPTGLAFSDNGNGTATISGTPETNSTGTYDATITASNGISPNGMQTLRVTSLASSVPRLTSADTYGLVAGAYTSFVVTTSGSPTPTLSASGGLPAGMIFTARSDGTATIAGTPAPASTGSYNLYLTATNAVGTAHQTLTITIHSAQVAFTSADSLSLRTSVYSRFTLTTSGSPAPAISATGRLPSGVSFTNNNNGTATIAGTPTSTRAGTYLLYVTATNGYGSPAHQTLAVTLNQSAQPSFTSASTFTLRVGTAATFTVTTTGSPTPTITERGGLPAGMIFSAHTNGTATIAGTPAVGSVGSYLLAVTATNGAGSPAQQSLRIDVTAGGAAGYWYVISNGQVLQRGAAPLIGSSSQHPRDIIAMASTTDGNGYYLISSFGGVFNYGDAHFYGSIARFHLRTRTVAFAVTPDGRGYWLVTARGNVFSYGDANFYGSPAGRRIPPVTAFARTPDGRGYWVVTSGGNIFNYGDAPFYGSLAGHRLPAITGFAANADGRGYWAVTSRGDVFSFGDASVYGSPASRRIPPVTAFTATPDGRGYWVVSAHGNIFNYGDAPFYGSSAGTARDVVGFAFDG